MATLYDLTKEQQELYDRLSEAIDPETGEVDAAMIAAIDTNDMALKEKFRSYAIVWKQLVADAEMYKAEEVKLVEKRKRIERNAETLKNRLESAMLLVGMPKLDSPQASISFRKATKVEVDEELLPKKYLIKKTTFSPDKTTLTSLLKAGTKIKGAVLVENQYIQIK